MPYEFTPEEFSRFSEEIIKAEGDQATLTSLLADMQSTVQTAIAKDIANTEKVETVTAENERLRKANMDLFLRVGLPQETPKKPEEREPDKPSGVSAYMQSYFERLDKAK